MLGSGLLKISFWSPAPHVLLTVYMLGHHFWLPSGGEMYRQHIAEIIAISTQLRALSSSVNNVLLLETV